MDVVVIDAAVVICDVVVAKYFDFTERFFWWDCYAIVVTGAPSAFTTSDTNWQTSSSQQTGSFEIIWRRFLISKAWAISGIFFLFLFFSNN